MSESEQCVAAEIMLLEAEAKIEQLSKEVLKLEAENQRLNKVINVMIKPFIKRL
jgi:hypothetical protein